MKILFIIVILCAIFLCKDVVTTSPPRNVPLIPPPSSNLNYRDYNQKSGTVARNQNAYNPFGPVKNVNKTPFEGPNYLPPQPKPQDPLSGFFYRDNKEPAYSITQKNENINNAFGTTKGTNKPPLVPPADDQVRYYDPIPPACFASLAGGGCG